MTRPRPGRFPRPDPATALTLDARVDLERLTHWLSILLDRRVTVTGQAADDTGPGRVLVTDPTTRESITVDPDVFAAAVARATPPPRTPLAALEQDAALAGSLPELRRAVVVFARAQQASP